MNESVSVSPTLTLPKSQPKTPSVRKTQYSAAPATGGQLRTAPWSMPTADAVGAVLGPLAQPLLLGTGSQAIWCRL